ncbi:chromosome partitioning protein [Bartonella sp. WD16.2]|nr:chromosome partitioning protein [Bartonella sp. WD16.2]
MSETRIIAIANQKGGVGKTTTAINLATALAAIGENILIMDIDPQGNASTGLGIDRNSRPLSSYDVLISGIPVVDAALKTVVPNLHIVPSTLDLLGVEMEIASSQDRIQRLRKALCDDQIVAQKFSYILIDCPPSLNLLTLNAMGRQILFWYQCSANF